MKIRRKLRNVRFSNGKIIKKSIDTVILNQFFERFRKHYISVELFRVGGDGDGGYLIPDILSEVGYCFSPGVDRTATFEADISASHGIKSFMADASVESAPFEDPNFIFDKKFLGNHDEEELITLKSWIDRRVGLTANNLLLQMDIEGGEYDVLVCESIETLKRFICIIIEFHYADNIFEENFFTMFSSIFEKLYQEFSICHVHPNNCCGLVSFKDIDVPRVFEVTLVRNDYATRLISDKMVSLPHPLDRNNVERNRDIYMPEVWWKVE